MARARFHAAVGQESDAEPLARGALAEFAAAMNWLEDTPEFEVAHYRLDEAGRWIRETFGCWLAREGTSYTRTCPADIAHIRVGFSPGMKNVIRECSVCGQDPRSPTCRHIKGRRYPAMRRLVEGRCNLCGERTCGHVDGEPGDVDCFHWIVSAEIDELSLVPRPADPMARIMKVSVPLSGLVATLGLQGWSPGQDVSCDLCLRPCGGVREWDRPPAADESGAYSGRDRERTTLAPSPALALADRGRDRRRRAERGRRAG